MLRIMLGTWELDCWKALDLARTKKTFSSGNSCGNDARTNRSFSQLGTACISKLQAKMCQDWKFSAFRRLSLTVRTIGSFSHRSSNCCLRRTFFFVLARSRAFQQSNSYVPSIILSIVIEL